jgi:formylglycine-generating enzyme required for sulfatase activity
MYAKPATLVDAGGFRLNLVCMGSGSPAVVFDSGWEDWAPAWSKVQPEVAKFTRACSYDRAGAGFSEAGPMPRTSLRIAQELRTALYNARVRGPYILVSSAFGSDNMRTFAGLYTKEVAGLVMVDADADDIIYKAGQANDRSGEQRIIAQLRDCRNAVAAHQPLPLLKSRPGQPQHTCAQQFFRGIPEAEWSPELNAKLLELATSKVAMYDAYLSEMEQFPADEAYLQQHVPALGARPIRVLSSGNHGVGHVERKPPDTPEHLQYEAENTAAQAQWLTLSSDSRQIFPQNSSEYIQFDRPDVVIGAIREVYEESRGRRAAVPAPAPGDGYRECAECPAMVVIPPGHFTMGSSDAEKQWAASHGGSKGAVSDEAPQHEVTLPSFALGKYDVTRGEYAAFVRATGYSSRDACGHGLGKWDPDPKFSWQDPGFTQTDRDPVVCVSWNDAQAYAAWLSKKTSHTYRLPSEAEWEYAARAGTTTRFWWGDDDREAAAHAWFRDNSGGEKVTPADPLRLYEFPGATHPVGLKPANAFGLYDITGNVWQWTEDCYDNSYDGVPADGRANQTPSKDPKANDSQGRCLRVDRGGSWMFPAWLLRPATRERNPVDFGDPIMGFRVAQDLR